MSERTDIGGGYLGGHFVAQSAKMDQVINTHRLMLREAIHLVASSSYPFPQAMLALAEPVCVFPVEGLPEARYLPGTEAMSLAEAYAEELLQGLFATGTSFRTTIQPHSGTQANQIVFNAVLKPGDIVLSLSATQGGHISHTVLVGRRNPVIHYPLNEGGLIDYDAVEQLAMVHRPRLIIAGGSSYPREVDFARFGQIARDCGAILHADISHTATFVAAGLHLSPFRDADFVSFNMVKNMRGPNGGLLMYRAESHKVVARGLFPDTQGGGNENTMLSKVAALEAFLKIDFRAYAARMVESARLISDVLVERGIRIVTGGTDSHLVLIDIRASDRTGAQVESECRQWKVLVNRNLVPGDRRGPMITSGVRIGTACLTILGYQDDDVVALAHWLADRIEARNNESIGPLVDGLMRRYNVPFFGRSS